MIPIETYYSNIIFSAEGCKDLHGTLIHKEDGPVEIETCWKLSEEELRHIAQTGCIYSPGSSSAPIAETNCPLRSTTGTMLTAAVGGMTGGTALT